MKNTLRIFTVLATSLYLAACVGGCSTPWGTAKKNVENSRNLRVGMTKGEVLEVMGEPIRDEKFCEPDLWFYYIEMVWGDGLITPEECMPLVFEDGKLIGWGNDFYLDHQIKRRKEDPGADLAKAEAEAAKKAEKKSAQTGSVQNAAAESAKPEAVQSPEAGKPESNAGASDSGKK